MTKMSEHHARFTDYNNLNVESLERVWKAVYSGQECMLWSKTGFKSGLI